MVASYKVAPVTAASSPMFFTGEVVVTQASCKAIAMIISHQNVSFTICKNLLPQSLPFQFEIPQP